MSTTSQSKTVVKRYVDAIAGGDERTIRDSFAADATWILRGELPISGTWKGRDVIVDEFLAAALNYYVAFGASEKTAA
jgi:ketosteroid isomerase-like protein